RAQLAVYANATCMWDDRQQCWVEMPPFDKETGVLLHLPQKRDEDSPPVQLLRMDLAAGWATAQRAAEVVKDRAAAKSAPYLRGLQIGPVKLDTMARVEARLALVETYEEGSQVLVRVDGSLLADDEVARLIDATIERISQNQLTSEL